MLRLFIEIQTEGTSVLCTSNIYAPPPLQIPVVAADNSIEADEIYED